MDLTFRPIDVWPGELTRNRKPSPFRGSWASTKELLDREVDFLCKNHRRVHELVVVQLAVTEGEIRQDGQLRAGARPQHPGVIVSFETPDGPMRFSCDRFEPPSYRPATLWHSNVRAIALGLEALRKVERYGLGTGREQYRGFQALPPGQPIAMGGSMTVEQAARVIVDGAGILPNSLPSFVANPELIDDAFRCAAKRNHPDVGGTTTAMAELNEAYEIVKADQTRKGLR